MEHHRRGGVETPSKTVHLAGGWDFVLRVGEDELVFQGFEGLLTVQFLHLGDGELEVWVFFFWGLDLLKVIGYFNLSIQERKFSS